MSEILLVTVPASQYTVATKNLAFLGNQFEGSWFRICNCTPTGYRSKISLLKRTRIRRLWWEPKVSGGCLILLWGALFIVWTCELKEQHLLGSTPLKGCLPRPLRCEMHNMGGDFEAWIDWSFLVWRWKPTFNHRQYSALPLRSFGQPWVKVEELWGESSDSSRMVQLLTHQMSHWNGCDNASLTVSSVRGVIRSGTHTPGS